MEEARGVCLAIKVAVEGLGGDEVGAVDAGELEAGFEGVCSQGAEYGGVEVHLAAETCVGAGEQGADGPERGKGPGSGEGDGDIGNGFGLAEGALEVQATRVSGGAVGAGGVAPSRRSFHC